jgi:hypothetical protein
VQKLREARSAKSQAADVSPNRFLRLPKKTTALVLVLAFVLTQPFVVWAQEKDGWMPEILGQEAQLMEEGDKPKSETRYLPDYSYAGYRWGEGSLPAPRGTVIKTTEYGVSPDDGTDDTEALRRALREAHTVEGPVVVRLPQGRLHLCEILFLERSNIVLKGKGSGDDGTTFVVTRSLREMNVPEAYESRLSTGTSQFSWQGGVFWVRAPAEERRTTKQKIATARVGRRGHRVFYLERSGGIETGDILRIRWFNRSGKDSSLLRHVYCSSDLSYGGHLVNPQQDLISQEVTVTEVDGRRITVKEPLLHDIRPLWTVDVTSPQFLEEVGITGIRIVFPDTEYAGHHKEAGYNGLYLNNVAHGWVRDVTVENVDTGIIFSGPTKTVTARGIQVKGRGGHHGILVRGYGILVEDFAIHTNFLHSLSFGTGARGSVYTDGYAWMAKLDQHRGVNHQNLYGNLEVEYLEPLPQPLFRHGGSRSRWGPTAGAFNTFWNVQVRVEKAGNRPVWTIGKESEAPHGRIVGLHSISPPRLDIEYGPEAYIEGMNRSGIAVPSLYDYQRHRRTRDLRSPGIAILRPAHESQVQPGRTTTVEAVVQEGAHSVQRVVFYSDDEEIGTDRSGHDGWSTTWTPSQKGPHSLHAVLIDKNGGRVRSRSRSCTGKDQVVWGGTEEGQLKKNYPNPFSQKSVIRYAIPRMSRVRIELFDVQGRLVRVLVNDEKPAGRHTANVRGFTLSSGVYFYRITARGFRESGKLVVVK